MTFQDIGKRLDRHLLKILGHYPISDISAPLAIEKLKLLEREGKLDTLHRMIGYLNQIMVYAVNRGVIQYNPTQPLTLDGYLLSQLRKIIQRLDPKHYPNYLLIYKIVR